MLVRCLLLFSVHFLFPYACLVGVLGSTCFSFFFSRPFDPGVLPVPLAPSVNEGGDPERSESGDHGDCRAALVWDGWTLKSALTVRASALACSVLRTGAVVTAEAHRMGVTFLGRE